MKEKDFTQLSQDEQRETIRRESLPVRRKYLAEVEIRRNRILLELEGLESLVSGTLLFETEEEELLRRGISSLKNSLSRLDSLTSLLEENIRRVEDGGNL